jgi:hypothetical protein
MALLVDNESNFRMIIMLGNSLLLGMSGGATSQHIIIRFWMASNNFNPQLGQWFLIVIIVGALLVLALALRKVVLPSVVFNHHRPTDRIISQVLFQPSKPFLAAKTYLSFHGEGNKVDCDVSVAGCVRGNFGPWLAGSGFSTLALDIDIVLMPYNDFV